MNEAVGIWVECVYDIVQDGKEWGLKGIKGRKGKKCLI